LVATGKLSFQLQGNKKLAQPNFSAPPFLVIHSAGGSIFNNYSSPAETRHESINHGDGLTVRPPSGTKIKMHRKSPETDVGPEKAELHRHKA